MAKVAASADIQALRQRIRVMEIGTSATHPSLALGVAGLDDALPDGGLPLACVHEVHGETGDITAASGFVASILSQLAGPVVWIAQSGDLYMPGLQPFGIGCADLLFVRVAHGKDGLWTMEEALRWPGLRGVVAELDRFDLTATRRLQLAAEGSGVTGFILTDKPQGLSACTTRWDVRHAPSLGIACWQVELQRCKGGRAASATVLYDGTLREASAVRMMAQAV